MISIVSGDWHLDGNSRNEYRHTFVEKTLPDLVKTHNYDRLVCLGDLCQDKDRHSAELVNRVVDSITMLSKLCEVVILKGNHDYIDPSHPFFGFLKTIKDVTWIGKPTFLGDELFLPHTRDCQRDWKGLSLGKAKRIFAHQTFQGANAGNHIMDGIPLSVFPEDVDIISGDVHVPQKIRNLRYVGAPYTINFGDTYKPRVLILRGDKITTLPVHGPRKVLIEIDNPRHMPEVELHAGDMIKVRVKLDKFEEFQKIKKTTTEWAAGHGCFVQSIQPIVSSKTSVKGKAAFTVKSDADQVRAYAGKVGVSEAVLEIGLQLMELEE
jgi:predicted phosphodiesterase